MSSVTSRGAGDYGVSADGEEDGRDRRVGAITKGLIKLAQTEAIADDAVRFSCGQTHNAMVGLLLPRALNVRAVMREQEDQAARGGLADHPDSSARRARQSVLDRARHGKYLHRLRQAR